MAKINIPLTVKTHGGAPAVRQTPLQELRRSVLACLLWENQFYENGEDIAARILRLSDQVSKLDLMALAIEAREVFKLRHAPLLLLCALVKKKGEGVSDTIGRVIKRPDEMGELLSIYQKIGNEKFAKQLQKGIAKAFIKFDEYQLAKYNRPGQWTLKDVLFISHARPVNEDQDALWKRLINDQLATPHTWEVELSAGKDKGEVFTTLLQENKLGYLALLRNLRNMEQANVSRELVREALKRGNANGVLPFQFVAAARHAPSYEAVLNEKLITQCKSLNRMNGTTIVLVDVSGSMNVPLSAKSTLTRMDAAATLASMIDGDVRVITFSYKNVEVPHRLGMAGVEGILRSQPHGGTNLRQAVEHVNTIKHDRVIVITDEQGTDGRVPAPVVEKAYMINMGSYQNGVANGKNGWTSLTGFSENILQYIQIMENEE